MDRSLWMAGVGLAAALLGGCEDRGAGAPTTTAGGTSSPGGGAKSSWVIGMSQCNRGEPWRVQMDKDVEDAVKAHSELKVIFKDAQNNTSTQQDQVREFITQKVDLILISPKEAKPLTAPVKEAFDKGIPVIVLDRAVEGDAYTCFIGADNVVIGNAAGKYVAKLLGGKGKVVELKGLMTSPPGVDRNKGFRDGIREAAGIQVVHDVDCAWLEDKALNEMNSALSRFPDIDVVYGHNDPSAHGAWLAAKAEGKGREKTIKFIGIDALPHEGVKYVKEGILTATFQYPTGGKEAIDAALAILKGGKVEKKMVLGTRIFTKENVDKGGEEVK